MGGGTCTVATTVFNAIYEAGYPIVERVNHSLRSERYPIGRDAAIAYPYADLKFQNDTANMLLITMSFTDYSVTCTLWGISPGYKVESITGELVEGEDFQRKEVFDETLASGTRFVDQVGLKASKVEVRRIVYNSDGSVRFDTTF
jgi:vancomycin resistance protein YoaR